VTESTEHGERVREALEDPRTKANLLGENRALYETLQRLGKEFKKQKGRADALESRLATAEGALREIVDFGDLRAVHIAQDALADLTPKGDALDEWNEQERKASYWTDGPLTPPPSEQQPAGGAAERSYCPCGYPGSEPCYGCPEGCKRRRAAEASAGVEE
jgi:hypothetical protein